MSIQDIQEAKRLTRKMRNGDITASEWLSAASESVKHAAAELARRRLTVLAFKKNHPDL